MMQNSNSGCCISLISSNALASDVSRAGGAEALELVAALDLPEPADLDVSTKLLADVPAVGDGLVVFATASWLASRCVGADGNGRAEVVGAEKVRFKFETAEAKEGAGKDCAFGGSPPLAAVTAGVLAMVADVPLSTRAVCYGAFL